MDVYKRPMFLQGGGPPLPMGAPPNAAGAMAAPPMAGAGAGAEAGIPPELQMALAGAEQEGTAIGQGIGEKFAADMSVNLDSAEDYEQAINALRGNELPLSARYDELGEIVGEEDAKETPESVLALVQPAIMMTEKGAMNSGIGELMKELTGDVPMEGPMTEGVGALMAAGQPAEPPMGPMGPPPMGPLPTPPGLDPTALGPTLNGTPQGFAVGGAVTRFRNSPVVQNFAHGQGVNSLENLYKVQPTSAYYQHNLAELKDIIDTDEQTKLAKSQILFDIARRGLAFAGGVNPETGQRMTGSALSQFATAASGLPKTVGEQMAAIQAQKQKLKLAAYQGAQTQRAAAIGRATATTTAAPGAHILKFDPQKGKMVSLYEVPAKPLRPQAANLHYTEFTVGDKPYRTEAWNANDPKAAGKAREALQKLYPKLELGKGIPYEVGTKQKALTPRAAQMGHSKFITIAKGGEKVRTPVPMIALMSDGKKLFFDQVVDPGGNKKITAYQELKPKTTVTEIFKTRPEPAPTKATAPKEPFELTVISTDGKKAKATLPPDIAAKGGPAIRKWVKENENLKDGFGGPKGAANFLKSYTVKKLSAEGSGLGKMGTPAWFNAFSLDPVNMDVYRDPLMYLEEADTNQAKVDDVRRIMDTMDQAALNNVVGTTDLLGYKTIKGLRGPMLQALRSRMEILKMGKYGDTPLTAEQKNLLQLPPSVKAYINRLDSTIKADEDVENTSRRLDEGAIGSVNPETVDSYIRTAAFPQAFGGAPALLKSGLRTMAKAFVQDWFNPEEVAGKAFRTLVATTRRAVIAPLVGEKSRETLSGDFADEFKDLETETESAFTTVESARIHANNIKSIVRRALRDTIVVYKAARQSGSQQTLTMKAYAKMQRLEGVLANWDWVHASLAKPDVKTKTPTLPAESFFAGKSKRE